MADAIDDDTLAAIRSQWNDAPTLAGLLTDPPQAGRLVSPQTGAYCQIASVLKSRQLTGTAGFYHDRRTVTISVRGRKADVVAAQQALGDVFNRNTVLVYPSGARPFWYMPLPGDSLKEDPARKSGEDVWLGELVADVWSIRKG